MILALGLDTEQGHTQQDAMLSNEFSLTVWLSPELRHAKLDTDF